MRASFFFIALPFRLLLACFASLIWVGNNLSVADPAAEAPRRPPLKVTVEPTKTKVQLRETFKVVLRVVNVTAVPQHIRVMNCSWREHWQISNPQVSYIGLACAKNFAVDETIAAGAAYSKELEMLVLTPAECRIDAENNHRSTPALKSLISEGPLTFKMGFTPIGGPQTYWSDEIKIEVVPPISGSTTPKPK